MSSSTNAGFFFSFGDDNHAEASPPSPPKPHAEVEDIIPLARFPWYTLKENVLQSWLSCYPLTSPPLDQHPRKGTAPWRACATKRQAGDPPKGEPADAAFSGKPSPLSLTLSASGDQACTLYYQTALDLRSLVEYAPLSGGESEGRAPGSDRGARTTPELRDIIPGRYYGGLKVWSCAPDLARYVISLEPIWRDATRVFGREVSSLVFAEVGCGQALPALAAICVGARTVVLQDYNKEVLELCVKPNIGATIAGNGRSCPLVREEGSVSKKEVRVQLVHGDWAKLGWSDPFGDEERADGMCVAGCDVVLGSDVTFDHDACWKLSQLLQRWLRPVTGVAFIATKVYYFGTNGGSLEFAQCASRFGLTTEEVAHMDEEGGMRRVILKVHKTA
ncbi:unnamed protein product [Phytomonas sp. EM1]|nr:unnamed protein product [Phytomonas sp. EM1]|eukprot:CCW65797.1 unnamed protein product [Phytomonas sp. isolate EM1]